ncbi:MAG: hypothetical protein OER77_11200, partial [Myxococcales bacterium]|nr:hypothetical protein [Myxococcales bacterium]
VLLDVVPRDVAVASFVSTRVHGNLLARTVELSLLCADAGRFAKWYVVRGFVCTRARDVVYDDNARGWQTLTGSRAHPARSFLGERLAIARRKPFAT